MENIITMNLSLLATWSLEVLAYYII